MEEEIKAIISGVVYIKLVSLYQTDGYSIPCKDRTEVEKSITAGLLRALKENGYKITKE